MSGHGSPTTKRFVRGAWMLLAFQFVAATGAAGVAIWAATEVRSLIDQRDMLAARVETLEKARPAVANPSQPEQPLPVMVEEVPMPDAAPTPAPDAAPTPAPAPARPATPTRPGRTPPAPTQPIRQAPPPQTEPPPDKPLPPVTTAPPVREPVRPTREPRRPRINLPQIRITPFGSSRPPRITQPPSDNGNDSTQPPRTTRPPNSTTINRPQGIQRPSTQTAPTTRPRPRPTRPTSQDPIQ